MRLLFVHDTKIKEDIKGTFYTGGSFNNEVWNRYLSISTELCVIARKDQSLYDVEIAKSEFNYFDRERIEFVEIPDLNDSIKNFTNYKTTKYKWKYCNKFC